MARKKRSVIDRLTDFDKLSDTEKAETRIAWLEQKMVGVLWLLINASSLLFAAVVTWTVSEAVDLQSLWFRAPVFVFVWLVVGWWAQRRTFRDAPPHTEFIDPDL